MNFIFGYFIQNTLSYSLESLTIAMDNFHSKLEAVVKLEGVTFHQMTFTLPMYSVSHKKGNPDLISNLWKIKKRITKLITGMIVLLFFFHMTHWSRILANGWLISNNLCMTCQNYFFSKFWVLARLSCIKENPGLTQNFSKWKTDITKLTSVHDSIISQL